MRLNAVVHSRREQWRQETLGRRVLNSGWQVRSVAMLYDKCFSSAEIRMLMHIMK